MNLYLISKGWEGFADRFQCLSHCVSLALKHERVLFVDWDDRIWSHSDGGFFRYFNLVDLCYVTSTDAIPKTMPVFPRFWTRGLGLPADEWIHKVKDEVAFDLNQLNPGEPVWVHAGIGFRAFDFNQLPLHLRFSAEASHQITPLINQVVEGLPVVHLRGTDRPMSEERWAAVRLAAPVACVISDDLTLARRWMLESPQSVLISNTLVEDKAAGHKLDGATLARYGLSKHAMNIRLLADFLILAKADEAHALNEESLFFKMARLFGACGGVDKLMLPAPDAIHIQGAYIRPTNVTVQQFLATQLGSS
jgi:hypothetical protein